MPHGPRLGAHMSIGGGPAKALERGHSIQCDTIQLFTRGPNRWAAKELTLEQIAAFQVARAETGIDPIVAHSSYLINLAANKPPLWQKSIAALITELERCHQLGLGDYVLHPGSHGGDGVEAGLERVARALEKAFEATAEIEVRILIETTAGQGASLGHRFEELGWLLEHVHPTERLGACFDTAHVLAAGYEFRDDASYNAMWRQFDETIGLDRLGCIHLNDSKRDLNARVDRHEQLGEGFVGIEAFRLLINDTRLWHVPMILETPKEPDLADDVRNLAVLRRLLGMAADDSYLNRFPHEAES